MILMKLAFKIVVFASLTFSGWLGFAKETKKRVSASACAYEQNCDCKAPGVTLRWKMSSCAQAAGTDDYESAHVQKCLGKKDAGVDSRSECEQNVYWRRSLCLALHKADNAKYEDCEANFIPAAVGQGIGN